MTNLATLAIATATSALAVSGFLPLLCQCPRRLRVAAAFLADAERAKAGREAELLPPSLPPLWAAGFPVDLPRPDPPGFLPPASSLLTVAQARRSASFPETPRFS